jgi:hypothetical protein
MDDPETFGGVMYALPFGEAIKRSLLTDYRVVIIGVDDPTIAAWIADRELVRTRTGIETDSETLAAQIGILKAIKDYDLKRIITFHGRVKRAEAFANAIHGVKEWIATEHRPSGDLHTDFVSGAMPNFQRRVKLDRLKQLGSGERGILSNARCLSEGVDVPSLDGVAFVDPRSSQVDIIQAVGRAIRLSPDKKVGTIVLPVFIEAGQSPDEAIANSKFQPIWDVLNALKAHDDVLANELDQARTALGRRPDAGVPRDSLTKVIVDLPVTVGSEFDGALRTHLVEQVTAPWNFWFGLLQDYVERNGHAHVPAAFRTGDGLRLGVWVTNQRQQERRSLLSLDRKAQLQSLAGWTWDALDQNWEDGFRHLQAFIKQWGHANVPQQYKTDGGYLLGVWVRTQRKAMTSMSPERKARLEAVPGWTWDVFSDLWEKGFLLLQSFVEQNGDANVPLRYTTETGFQLGRWVGMQRRDFAKLPPKRKAQLELLPGWSWHVLDQGWDEGFGHLQTYVDQIGDAQVPRTYRTASGFRLGEWVKHQRGKRLELTPEKKRRLKSLSGWAWNAEDQNWDDGYLHLRAFIDLAGHANVPSGYRTEDGFRLGQWISVQRRAAKKGKMSPERKARLQALPGWTWDTIDQSWEEAFRRLQSFVNQNGTATVPERYRTESGFYLGAWVFSQRNKREIMSPQRKARLERLPGWVWKTR